MNGSSTQASTARQGVHQVGGGEIPQPNGVRHDKNGDIPITQFSELALHSETISPGLSEVRTYSNDGVIKEVTFGTSARTRPLRIVCIGAGCAGIYTGIKVPRTFSPEQVELQIYEKNETWAGVWFENVYPGVQCDVPAHVYSYSFEPYPKWSNFYANGAQIREYFSETAEKYHVGKYVKFEHRVLSAHWAETGVWHLKVRQPDGTVIDDFAHVLINATGSLNNWKWPSIPGLKDFKGVLQHSAKWDNKAPIDKSTRVGVIGNGSSAIQIVPKMQQAAQHVVTFFRSPTWIALPFANAQVSARHKAAGVENHVEALYDPDLYNPQYTDEERKAFKDDPEALRKYRHNLENENAARFITSNRKDSPGAKQAIEMLSGIMKKRLEKKPWLGDVLIPTWSVGCRRTTPGAGYLEALCEDNVDVVTTPIEAIVEKGVRTKDGTVHEVDVLVCATGFDVSTRPQFELVGRDGYTFTDEWAERPRAYFTHSFSHVPNYFIYNGPNAPVANGSLIPMMEATGDAACKMIEKMIREDIRSFCVKQEREDQLTEWIDAWMPRSVWSSGCRSWYKNGTIDGRVSGVWAGSGAHFLNALEHPRWEDYSYSYLSERNPFSYLGNGLTRRDEDPVADKAWYLHGRHFETETPKGW